MPEIVETPVNEELFQLQNGCYIISEEQSKKMFYIKEVHPELPATADTGYEWNEMGLAELFSECYENNTRYCPQSKCWYTYHEGAWRKDIGNMLVSERIKEFMRIMLIYCGEILDEEIRKSYIAFINKMGDRRCRDRIMKDAASVNPIDVIQFDQNPYLINCLNGTYDLKQGIFRSHDWRDFLTMQTNFNYTIRKDCKCKRWEQFIKEICCNDEEKADYLQRALGYSMIGLANEECMFILHGKTTRNGKSTLLNTISHMLGDYSTVAPVSIICKAGNSNAEAANPALATLKGRRFVTMSESSQYGKLNEEIIKQLTGGEEISARNLYESQMTFLPQFTLWLSCNDLPAVRDKSLFASDRVRVIEFNRHFTNQEQDKNLKTMFQSAESMQGIFKWLIDGYTKYCKSGLTMNETMMRVVKQYEKDNDIILQFIEERCQKDENAFTKAKAIYDNFKLWCTSNGYKPCSSKKFYSELDGHSSWHDGRRIRDGYSVYYGISLRETIL